MSREQIGSCSLCGGDVKAHVGPWAIVVPPAPPTCSQCGAQAKSDVIEMVDPPWKAQADGSGL
jgi:hypothetical protein